MRVDNNLTGSIHIDNGNFFPFPELKLQPDLLIDESKIIWSKENKRIDFKIKNRGLTDAEGFYITIKYQEKHHGYKELIRFWIGSLEAGKSIAKSFDLNAYANRYNDYLQNVEKLLIIVDDSHQIKESNEKNNIELIKLNQVIKYTIQVQTGNIPHAGTDAAVYIRLYGSRGISDYIQLDNAEDNHEKGKKDIYTILHKDLGSLQKVDVQHDNQGEYPGWFLESILIKADGYNYNFIANEWLSSSSKEEHPTITIREDNLREKYHVTVTTSDILHAGTDATIYVRLYGEENKQSSLQRIGNQANDFERGTTQTFLLRCDFDLGDVEKIYIEQDNTGDSPLWHIEKVTVRNPHTQAESLFIINHWLGGKDNKIVAFKNTPIKELTVNSTRQVRVTTTKDREHKDIESIELFADGKPYAFSCSAGSYQGCGIDAAHSFMGWFKTDISRGTIKKYVETTDYTGPFKDGDILTSPAQMSRGLKHLVNKIQPQYKNKITRHHTNNDYFVINKIRDYLLRGMPVVALINKGYHWVTLVGMECHYTNTHTLDIEKSSITYIDLTKHRTLTKSYKGLKICGWESFWGHAIYSSYTAGTIISLHNHLLKSSHAKKAYRFEIYTSEIVKAGTDANVYITLHGKDGKQARYSIDTICNDFEKGEKSVQSFIVEAYMPEIRSISIERNNNGSNPNWHLSHVNIVETQMGKADGKIWHFPIYDWIDAIQEEQFFPSEENNYLITVYTGNIAHAGTNARVYLKLYGTQGETSFLQLDNLKDNHEKNSIDKYIIPYPNIGDIQKIKVKHDNTGEKAGWFLEKISIRNKRKTYNFTARQWLSHSNRDVEPSIIIKEDKLRIPYHITIKTSNSKKAGTDAAVYIQLFGQHGKKTALQRIDQENVDDFEKGDIGNYTIYSDEDLGEINEIKLEHDNTGDGAGWKIAQVVINNHYIFNINEWLESSNKNVHPSKIFRR
jgi:hypothetical protein